MPFSDVIPPEQQPHVGLYRNERLGTETVGISMLGGLAVYRAQLPVLTREQQITGAFAMIGMETSEISERQGTLPETIKSQLSALYKCAGAQRSGMFYRFLTAPTPIMKIVRQAHIPEHLFPVTPRRTDILGMVSQGFTNREIASKLWLTTATIKSHLQFMTHEPLRPDGGRELLGAMALLSGLVPIEGVPRTAAGDIEI